MQSGILTAALPILKLQTPTSIFDSPLIFPFDEYLPKIQTLCIARLLCTIPEDARWAHSSFNLIPFTRMFFVLVFTNYQRNTKNKWFCKVKGASPPWDPHFFTTYFLTFIHHHSFIQHPWETPSHDPHRFTFDILMVHCSFHHTDHTLFFTQPFTTTNHKNPEFLIFVHFCHLPPKNAFISAHFGKNFPHQDAPTPPGLSIQMRHVVTYKGPWEMGCFDVPMGAAPNPLTP